MSTAKERLSTVRNSDHVSIATSLAAGVGQGCLAGAAFGIYATFVIVSNEVLVNAGVAADSDAVKVISWSLQVPLFASMAYANLYAFNVFSGDSKKNIDKAKTTLAFTGVMSILSAGAIALGWI